MIDLPVTVSSYLSQSDDKQTQLYKLIRDLGKSSPSRELFQATYLDRDR